MHCSAVVVMHVSRLLVLKLSNKLDIALNHGLIIWRAVCNVLLLSDVLTSCFRSQTCMTVESLLIGLCITVVNFLQL